MIQMQSSLDVADNSGAKRVQRDRTAHVAQSERKTDPWHGISNPQPLGGEGLDLRLYGTGLHGMQPPPAPILALSLECIRADACRCRQSQVGLAGCRPEECALAAASRHTVLRVGRDV